MNDRVEIAPHYDLWMQGARFGRLVSTFKRGGIEYARVMMDHPQVKGLKTFKLDDLKFL